MKWTNKLPDKPGYYWFYDGEWKETYLVQVKKYKDAFYASDEELNFEVTDSSQNSPEDKWCYIPKPE